MSSPSWFSTSRPRRPRRRSASNQLPPCPLSPAPEWKPPTRPAPPLPASGPAIRAWAREQGLPVGVRGRLAAEIVTAYAIAHGLEVPVGSTQLPPS
ncbi:Lsr2 family DNA-binding protein [Micromonospora chersina]|uniref:Lsr2 family DNA-binding protein n=1 Tax=Micromonospora chersina TaxID=47854 RepID=UPI003F54167B